MTTALKKYARLEATALWRAAPGEQRREVVVSIGDATLTISDLQDRAITHWSLAAVERANPGQRPAIYHPDGDPGETLELGADEGQMTDAIEKLRRAVARTRPKPGRLRWLGLAASVASVVALGVFWLPGALVSHATSVVPPVKRAEIGAALLDRIERMAGPECDGTGGRRSLSLLRARLGTGPISLISDAPVASLHLPGGRIVIDGALVEDYEEPDVAAGFIVAEKLQLQRADPLRDMLEVVGTRAAFTLLTTGALQPETLDLYAQALLRHPVPDLDAETMLAGFAAARLRSTPYALARDVTGESVLALIEGDPMAGQTPPALLSDAEWLRLQAICDG
jgi:hypothetical protein